MWEGPNNCAVVLFICVSCSWSLSLFFIDHEIGCTVNIDIVINVYNEAMCNLLN